MVFGMVLVVLIFAGGAGGLVFVLAGKVKGSREVLEFNIRVKEDELKAKREILSELALLTLGFAPQEALEAAKGEITGLEESLRSQRGRLTITEAELEAVETRQRELEEIERELETSSIEAGRELEMLRAQERDFNERNEAMKADLEKTSFSVDLLVDKLTAPPEVITGLKDARQELLSTEEQIVWFSKQISAVNQKYMELKRAYDALDIEYAQLYEKQNALMTQQ